MSLLERAKGIREHAYAPYSNFHVGAALQTVSGAIFTGCNVENAAYPEGTCAEAGAIAAMVAGGEREIEHIAIIADCARPLAPCGGCRQKILEFATSSTIVTMATLKGETLQMSIQDLLPGAFEKSDLPSE